MSCPVPVVDPLIRPKVLTRRATASAAPAPAPVIRIASEVRKRARAEGAALLVRVMRDAGVTLGDVAAALDMQERRIVEMRMGERPVHLEHVALACARLPALRAELLRLLASRV